VWERRTGWRPRRGGRDDHVVRPADGLQAIEVRGTGP
jgi:hypothetical protein